MKVFFAWLICCLIWGTTWIFIKIGLDDLPPINFVAARFMTAIVILFVITRLYKIPFPRKLREWRLLVLTGILTFSVNYGLLFWGEQYITSGLAAILQATIPAFGLIFAAIYLPGEKITLPKILGLLLGIVGISVIFYEQLHVAGWLAFAGSIAVVIGSCSSAFANILVKTYNSHLHPLTLTLCQMICGFLPIFFIGWRTEGNFFAIHWTTKAVIAVLYLAIFGTIVAFGLYYYLLQRIEAVKAMFIALVTPIIALIIGKIFLNETLPQQTFAGSILVLLSVGLVLFGAKIPFLNRQKELQ